MNKKSEPELSVEEVVATALNEHGYLLHHKVVDTLRIPQTGPGPKHNWQVEATEVPVSLPSGEETRIDIVLQSRQVSRRELRVIMECKRSARDFKRWVFFGESPFPRRPSTASYYVECGDLSRRWDNQGEVPLNHRVERSTASEICPVFNYGIEVRTNWPGNEKKSSSTNAIEDAFQQVALGQAGLALKIKAAKELSFRLFPVVVTTAELFSAAFPLEKVPLETGMIDAKDLKLESTKWLAVNYHINDTICRRSGISVNQADDLGLEIEARQVRSIFVAQASYLDDFLRWLENNV